MLSTVRLVRDISRDEVPTVKYISGAVYIATFVSLDEFNILNRAPARPVGIALEMGGGGGGSDHDAWNLC